MLDYYSRSTQANLPPCLACHAHAHAHAPPQKILVLLHGVFAPFKPAKPFAPALFLIPTYSRIHPLRLFAICFLRLPNRASGVETSSFLEYRSAFLRLLRHGRHIKGPPDPRIPTTFSVCLPPGFFGACQHFREFTNSIPTVDIISTPPFLVYTASNLSWPTSHVLTP